MSTEATPAWKPAPPNIWLPHPAAILARACRVPTDFPRLPPSALARADPLDIGSKTKEEIAWFRHAEIKHGRVAMAAFVGYTVQSLGLFFPGKLSEPIKPSLQFENVADMSFAQLGAVGGPADQWDALPTAAKVQILLTIGLLEVWGESSGALEADGKVHYMRGGAHSPRSAHAHDARGGRLAVAETTARQRGGPRAEDA